MLSEDFCILGNDFSKNRRKREIPEALFVQQLQPSFNTQGICSLEIFGLKRVS